MKISVPIEIRKEGGVYTFLDLFIRYLESSGIEYNQAIEGDEDVLLTNSWVLPYRLIKKAKNKNRSLIVLHRIDGSARDYGRVGNADSIQAKVNKLADVTIFQSHYGKYATKEKFPIIKNDGPVIYNPVDINTYIPEGEIIQFPYECKICCATFSTNPQKGRNVIYELADRYKEYDFILCGRFDDTPIQKNIYNLGLLDKYELAKAMRSCDLFLFPSRNETCPNVVLEAIASGLPIIFHPSGGTHELVGDCGFPLNGNFKKVLSNIMNNREALSTRARSRAVNNFSPEIIFKKYLDKINNVKTENEQKSYHGKIFNRLWKKN